MFVVGLTGLLGRRIAEACAGSGIQRHNVRVYIFFRKCNEKYVTLKRVNSYNGRDDTKNHPAYTTQLGILHYYLPAMHSPHVVSTHTHPTYYLTSRIGHIGAPSAACIVADEMPIYSCMCYVSVTASELHDMFRC